ncbi:hypothetical protein J1614_011255 [Plenodomus biglobosus]|nr:hypothetical protein J1614_011255 [Plenodomus biglobosus]
MAITMCLHPEPMTLLTIGFPCTTTARLNNNTFSGQKHIRNIFAVVSYLIHLLHTMGKNKAKHWNRNKNRASLGSNIDAAALTTSTAGTTSGSPATSTSPASRSFKGTSRFLKPSNLELRRASQKCGRHNKPHTHATSVWGGRIWDWLWAPWIWLNPNQWGPRTLSWKLCRAIRWIYNFCVALSRIQWDAQRCRDLLLTLGSIALYMYALYVVLGFIVSQVASAQEMEANCSVVYVTIPGPIITVSLIAASPSNPARGTYYFSVINGTTGWLDSIAPPSRYSTLRTKTPDITPIISSLYVTALPSGQSSTSSIGSSSTSVSPSLPLAASGTTILFTTTLLSGSTLVNTVITLLPPPSTSSASLIQTPTSMPLATSNPVPINEPQRPWPSPVVPSSSIMPSSGPSATVSTLFLPSSQDLLSTILGPSGTPTSGSTAPGLTSSLVSTMASITAGLPPNTPSTGQPTISTVVVILTSIVSSGLTTILTSTSTTILVGRPPTIPSPTVAPVTSTTAITITSTLLGGATTTLISLSTTILDQTSSSSVMLPTVPMTSSLGRPLTSTFSGGATSVLIGSSSSGTIRPPPAGSPTLGTPIATRVPTTLTTTLPGGLTTNITIASVISIVPPSPTSGISVTSVAPMVSNVITAVTSTASNGRPTTAILTVTATISQESSIPPFSSPSGSLVTSNQPQKTKSDEFTVSLPNPSTGPGVSIPPGTTSLFTITRTQVSSGLTTTVILVSSTDIDRPASPSSLPLVMTTGPSSLIIPSSTLGSSSTGSSMRGSAINSSASSSSSNSISTSGLTKTSSEPVPPSITPPPSSPFASLMSSSMFTSSSLSGMTSSIISSSFRSSTVNLNPSISSTSPSSLASFTTTLAPLSTTTTTTILTRTFANTSSISTSSSSNPGLPPILTSSFRFNTTSSSLSSSSSSNLSSILGSSASPISGSALPSRDPQVSSSVINISSVTGFMSIQTETTATRSPLSSLFSSSLHISSQNASTSTISVWTSLSSFRSNSAATSFVSLVPSSRSTATTSGSNLVSSSSIWSSSQSSIAVTSTSGTAMSSARSTSLPVVVSTSLGSYLSNTSQGLSRSSSMAVSSLPPAVSVTPSVTTTSSLATTPLRSESSALPFSTSESASAIGSTESLRPVSTPSPAGSFLTRSVLSTETPRPSTSLSSLASSTQATSGLNSTPEPEPSESFSFQVRDRTTKVISYGDTAISFVFPSPDITTTMSYWTGVYPTVTGPLPSDLETIRPTTRSDRQTPLSALPSFELFTSKRRSFKTVVTTIYDDDPEEGIEKRQDMPTLTQMQDATTAVMTIPVDPEPTLCGESGNFTLTFDDTVVGNDDNLLLVANGMKNPYHHLFYANGFTYVPDKWEPFPAISQPNVAMFLPLTGRLFPNMPFAGTLLPGEIGAGPRASVNAYWFNAYSAYFGCALNGLTPCTLRISGYRYDTVLKEEVLVVEQNATIAACWGYINCRLTEVFFNDQFRALSGIQFNAYTYNLGIPQVHMMDDLQMEWYNNTCSAGILRIGHV